MFKGEEKLSGVRKVAIFLIALGVNHATPLLKNLTEDELETVTVEIAKLKNLSPEIVGRILMEYYELMMAERYTTQGGLGFAEDMLKQAIGSDKARDLLMKVKSAVEMTGFNLLQTVNPNDLLNFLQKEHPQTIALLLANMKTRQAAEILSDLPTELQAEVAYRLATMGKTSPELLKEIEEALTLQMEGVFGGQLMGSGGVKAVAEILNAASRAAETNILEILVQKNPELASEINKLMFVFDDLVRLRDRDIQRILKDVDNKTLAMALKISSDKLQEKLFKNLSQQAAEALKEEIEYLGPVRVKEVEEAQWNILEHVQELENSGEILGRVSSDDFIE
ncbi:MAG: flagellar motor switch protein FliG [bacterium]